MECKCFDPQWPADELLMKTVAIVMTTAKVFTAAVSCITALMLVHIIPDLLSVKTRELFLKNKAAELDREMGLIRTQEETGRHVRMLTHEIRSTLDRHTILKTTLIELGRTLTLEECALWMPRRTGLELQLSYSLRQQNPVGYTVPIHLLVINQVFGTSRAVKISPNSPVARLRPLAGKYIPGEVVAIRVPLLHLSNFRINDWPELSTKRYALMVLMLPSDSASQWHVHELELIAVVANQACFDILLKLGILVLMLLFKLRWKSLVAFKCSISYVYIFSMLMQVAVALSHAAILEESMRARDLLMEQNVALDLATREAETAIRARNDFLAVMNHEMRTPMHATIALSALLQETELTPEQRLMVETIMKSSNLLATLINDVLDLSRLEDGSLQLDIGSFNLRSVLNEVMCLIKPAASVKKLHVVLNLTEDLPEHAVGDEKRLMQIILNVVGNGVKFSMEGSILVIASVAKAEFLRDTRSPEFFTVRGDNDFYLRVQVKDSGSGISPQDIPKLFTKFAQNQSLTLKSTGGSGLGLAICKRFVNLMDGHIWIESEGQSAANRVQNSFPGLKVLLVDDNSVSRAVTRGLLLHLGCEVTTVSSREECLHVVSQDHRVVIMEVCVSGVDSYDIAVQIHGRFTKLHERPLIVALTRNTDKLTKENCMRVGMDGVIVKPVSIDKMRTVLSDLLEHRVLF
ncbi:hypothetical protein MLD38_031542 [Melastoma candidum]|uniref:Uncharacterized protein n=1 Tax=Melastoma candidum TaxID=119954 RepID=A0ACB9MQJ4_9MYRT|nr:hypothetical protein MLD38_031542 [Melastoma candidum]